MKTVILCIAFLLASMFCYCQNNEQELIPEIEFSTFKFYNQNLGWLLGAKKYQWISEIDIFFGEKYEDPFAYITRDGGKHWETIQHECKILIMDFVSETIGWAIDEKNVLLKTEDGGRTWIKQKEFRVNWALSAMHFSEHYQFLSAIVTGTPYSSGKIFISYDKGINWVEKNVANGLIDWYAIEFWDDFAGTVFGHSSSEGMVMYFTDDAGLIWVKQKVANWDEISEIQLCSKFKGYYIGSNYNHPNISTNLVKSIDAFKHSEVIDRGLLYYQAVTDSIIYSLHHGIIKKTTDAGENWTNTPIDICCLKLCFTDELNGLLVATPNVLYRTTNGGETWQKSSISELNIYKTNIPNHEDGVSILLNDNEFIVVKDVRTCYQFSIIDIIGKEVSKGIIKNNERIPIHNLKKGTYLIQLRNSDGIFVERFIKI